MHDIISILRFGAPYLKRYWFRLLLGVLFGILFGLSNGAFVWGTTTIFKRIAGDSGKPPPVGPAAIGALAGSSGSQADVTPTPTEANPPSAESEQALPFYKRFRNSVGEVMDRLLPLRGRPIDLLQILGGLLFLPVLGAFRGYIGYLSSYCMSWVSERVIRDLRLDVLTKLNTLSLDFFNRTTMGELLARVNGDTTALYRCLTMGFSDLVKEPITILGCVLALLYIDVKLTLLALVFTPLTLIPMRLLGKKMKNAIKSAMDMGMSQDSLLVEVFSSIRIVKAFNLEQWQIERFRKIYGRLVHMGMKSVQAKELINPTIEIISMFGLGIVIVVVFYTQTTVPQLVGFLTGVIMMYTPIKKLGGLHVFFQQASIGAQRLIGLFSLQPTVKEQPNPIPLRSFSREISFENVSFSYGDKPVLQEINLRIPKGMQLGIAGPSGSGKSTLVNLVLRFFDPAEGAVKIDGIDFRDVSMTDLRNQMAFVSQEVVVFDQTFAENIACGKLDATQEEIEAAAKAANAHDFIMEKGGYHVRIGERGVTLSGGQRQRLAIARAFVRNAPILVLDEATASLDSQSEAEVQAAIDRLSENRTVICIAHRLSTLRNCDQVIVIHEGRIKEKGSFDELLQTGPIFHWMASKQGLVPQSAAVQA